MSTQTLYRLKTTGNISSGFNANQVINDFASSFRTSTDKARALLNGQSRVLKIEIDHTTSKRYQEMLHRMGVETKIEPMPNSNLQNLSLEPIDEDVENPSFQKNHFVRAAQKASPQTKRRPKPIPMRAPAPEPTNWTNWIIIGTTITIIGGALAWLFVI